MLLVKKDPYTHCLEHKGLTNTTIKRELVEYYCAVKGETILY